MALGAQLTGRPAAPAADSQEMADTVVVDSASPRATLGRFYDLTRRGAFSEASAYLSFPAGTDTARLDDLTRRLSAVLDARLWVDLEQVSPHAEGARDDGLPSNRELLGTIKTTDDRELAIRLGRVGSGDTRTWKFSEATVSQIDDLYSDLPDNWIREHIPGPLLNPGPFGILRWQWLALFILIPTAFIIGWVLEKPSRFIFLRLSAKTDTEFDDKLILAARGPVILLWSVAASRVLLRWIALSTPVQAFIVNLQGAIATAALFWLVLRAIGAMQETVPLSDWGARHPALRSLIPLGARIARLLIFLIAVLTVVSQFGYPVATIVAGLGIGGIAIALGAQKSLEHFFGSVSIGVDQPFRVGDWINVGGKEGEVEAIGLRSTQIRTMDRTLLSIPNGQLSETQTENFAPRDRIYLRTVIGLEYSTTSAKLRVVRDDIEKVLRAHPLTWQERVVVRLYEFGPYALNIEIFCWIETTVVDEFRAVREDLFIKLMEVVEGHGVEFAFPTQRLLMGATPPPMGPGAT